MKNMRLLPQDGFEGGFASFVGTGMIFIGAILLLAHDRLGEFLAEIGIGAGIIRFVDDNNTVIAVPLLVLGALVLVRSARKETRI